MCVFLVLFSVSAFPNSFSKFQIKRRFSHSFFEFLDPINDYFGVTRTSASSLGEQVPSIYSVYPVSVVVVLPRLSSFPTHQMYYYNPFLCCNFQKSQSTYILRN